MKSREAARGITLNKYSSNFIVREPGDKDYNSDPMEIKSLIREGAGLAIGIAQDGKGGWKALTDNPEDVIGAKAMEAWDAAETGESPILWILRALHAEGIAEVNGTSVPDMLEDAEEANTERLADESPELCQCAAAMYTFAFGMVAATLERWGKRAIRDGDFEFATQYALALATVGMIGKQFEGEYHGLELNGQIVHDLFHTLGISCPDLDGPAEPKEGAKRETRHFEA